VEACSFRDALPRFEGINAVVLGISADSVESHAKFKKKYELPYTLLADTDHKVSEAYGVWGPKTIFGVKYDGISRTTFVVDEEGRVARVFEKVKSAGHGQEVAAALSAKD
jgi:thioredoxin-dependent peroxiredoxin